MMLFILGRNKEGLSYMWGFIQSLTSQLATVGIRGYGISVNSVPKM